MTSSDSDAEFILQESLRALAEAESQEYENDDERNDDD